MLAAIAAFFFIVSSGLFFNERFRANIWAVLAAGLIATTSTYFLFAEITSSILGKKSEALVAAKACTKQFLRINASDPHCEFALSQSGELQFKSSKVSAPIVVTVAETLTSGLELVLPPDSRQRSQFGPSSDKRFVYAKSVEVFPISNTGRYYFVKACEDEGASFCWVYFIFDTIERKLIKTEGGITGPADGSNGRLTTSMPSSIVPTAG